MGPKKRNYTKYKNFYSKPTNYAKNYILQCIQCVFPLKKLCSATTTQCGWLWTTIEPFFCQSSSYFTTIGNVLFYIVHWHDYINIKSIFYRMFFRRFIYVCQTFQQRTETKTKTFTRSVSISRFFRTITFTLFVIDRMSLSEANIYHLV